MESEEKVVAINGRPRQLLGRKRIYSRYKNIDRNNLLEVLDKAMNIHRENVREMNFLIEYERGKQPLVRPKKIRPDIDIRVNANLANYVKEFKIAYNWGNPVTMVQRGNKELHDTDSGTDDSGISALNETLINGENIGWLDQCMAEFVEVCGIGHRMVDIKTDDWDDGSLVDLYTLDSRYAFVVYYDGPGQKKVLGVTFSCHDGSEHFTCYTDKSRFEVEIGEIVSEEKNPLGKIPIVEYERAFDRTGCFEREISRMDALNVLLSDITNDVAQRTQEIWWADNVSFMDAEGNSRSPKSGEWVCTSSDEGKTSKIQPLSSTFDGSSTLNAIQTTRTEILQDCKVPLQYDNSGGGSTGSATDMSAGWSATELDAVREQQMIAHGKREELSLILKAIAKVPERKLPMDAPIRLIHTSDIDLHFTRKKNTDMSVKANTFATYFNAGIHPRHILKMVDAFEDTEQVYLDSKDMLDALQENMKSSGSASDASQEHNFNTSGDPINQTGNSPIIDGMNTDDSKVQS